MSSFLDTADSDSRLDGFPGSSNEYWEAFPDLQSTFADSPDQSCQPLPDQGYPLTQPSSLIPNFAVVNAHWHTPDARDWPSQPDHQSVQYRQCYTPTFNPQDSGLMSPTIPTTHSSSATLDAGSLSMFQGYSSPVVNGPSPVYDALHSPPNHFPPPGGTVPSHYNSSLMFADPTELFNSDIGTPSERMLPAFAGLTLNSSYVPSGLRLQPMAPRPPTERVQRRNSRRDSSVTSSPYPPMRTSSLPVQATTLEETALHICQWVKDDGTLCRGHITRETTSQHLVTHGIVNKRHDNRMRCRWFKCRIKGDKEMMKRESIVRHVREKHLGYRRTL